MNIGMNDTNKMIFKVSIYLALILIFSFKSSQAIVLTEPGFIPSADSSADETLVSVDISDSTKEHARDIAVTSDYIILTGTADLDGNPYCVTVVLDHSGNELSSQKLVDTTGTYQYYCNGLTIDSNNKIYVGGYFAKGSDHWPLVIRYKILFNDQLAEGGRIDVGGTSYSTSYEMKDIIVFNDYIFLSGVNARNLSLAGLDKTTLLHSGSGMIPSDDDGNAIGVGMAMAKDSDEHLYIAGIGQDSSLFYVLRMAADSTGAVSKDTDFGSSGFYTKKESDYTFVINDIVLDDDGLIWLTGARIDSLGRSYLAVYAINANGRSLKYEIVESFAGAGYGITVKDDAIYVAGYTGQVKAKRDFILLRYVDGSRDESFGNSGKITFDLDGGQDTALAIALGENHVYPAGYGTKTSAAEVMSYGKYQYTTTTEETSSTEETTEETSSTEETTDSTESTESDGTVTSSEESTTTDPTSTDPTSETSDTSEVTADDVTTTAAEDGGDCNCNLSAQTGTTNPFQIFLILLSIGFIIGLRRQRSHI